MHRVARARAGGAEGGKALRAEGGTVLAMAGEEGQGKSGGAMQGSGFGGGHAYVHPFPLVLF